MSQYIGKTISLISNKGLRYVGLLDNINADDATVALKSVRSLGTEGRLAQTGLPNLEVMPGNEVYDYVVFRGSDVKDLTVLDIPIDQIKADPYVPPVPTSGYYQQQMQQAKPTPTQPQAAPAAVPSTPKPTSESVHAPAEFQPSKTQQDVPTHVQEQVDALPAEAPTSPENAPATDRSQINGPEEPAPISHPQERVSRKAAEVRNVPDTAFDFESANARFNREAEAEKNTQKISYNKSSSFFDTISSSADERNSMRWSEEKSLNMDTFGESSVGNRGNGRGRGSGRGGRGGWRGRGNGRRGRGNKKNTLPEWA